MRFNFTAMDSEGRENRGELDAATQAEAIALIRSEGLFPTRVSSARGERAGRSDSPAGVFSSAQRLMTAEAERERAGQRRADVAAAGEDMKQRARRALPQEILRTVVGFGIAIAAVAFWYNAAGKNMTSGSAAPSAPEVEVNSLVPGVVTSVFEFRDWRAVLGGVEGTLTLHDWPDLPFGRTISPVMSYKAYDVAGVVVDSGPVYHPELAVGESGKVSIYSAEAKRADRIVITIE